MWTIEENNIGAGTTIEMSLRLPGRMDESDMKDTSETEEEGEKKRKLEETSKSKSTRTSEESIFLQKEIIDAIRKSEEKMEIYSWTTDEKMDTFLLKITDSVGTQLHGMNSTIVKMKEEDDRYKQINEIIMNMERKILDMDEKCENRSDEPKVAHVDQNQGEAVVTGFHSETSESEVVHLLKETKTAIGMSIGKARIKCLAKPITHAFIYFKSDDERNKYIRSANMLRKELRGRKLKITQSMDVEERFHQKRMEYVKYCIHVKHDIPLDLISVNWTLKHVSVKGQIVVKSCQSGSLKFNKNQDIETEVEGQMEKWQTKNTSQRL